MDFFQACGDFSDVLKMLNTSDLWFLTFFRDLHTSAAGQRSWGCGEGSPFLTLLLEHAQALSSSSGDENTTSSPAGPQQSRSYGPPAPGTWPQSVPAVPTAA